MRLPLSFHTITSVAHFWGTTNVNLVLHEPVQDWLAGHDMAFRIEYVEVGGEPDYFIVFEREHDAVFFKLRWF